MMFKDATTERGFQRLHPETQAAAILFDGWSRHQKLPEAVITDVEDNGKLGRKPTSWHMPRRLTAIDFKNIHYRPDELKLVEGWFELRFFKPMWELITKPHGTAPHIHLARRDWGYLPPKEKSDG